MNLLKQFETNQFMRRSIWNTYQGQMSKMNFSPVGLVLYAPLGFHGFSGSSFEAWDIANGSTHTCTVTGALWSPKGRWFDKIDDLINCGSGASLDNIFDGGGTVAIWVNLASNGEGNTGQLFAKAPGWFITQVEPSKLRFYTYWSGTDGYWTLDNADLTFNVPHLVAVTYNSDATTNDPIIYIDGVSKALTEGGTPTETRTSDAANTLYVGNSSDASRTVDGYISEVWGYNRILSTSEITYLYNQTKGRYT